MVIANKPMLASLGPTLPTPSNAPPAAPKDKVELGGGQLTTAKKWLYNSIFPTNWETTTSKDYMKTRRWLVVHDFAMNVGNFAVGAAMGAALGWNPMWSGASMNMFNQIKGKICETAGFATNYVAPAADKNPRPWLIAGTLGDTAGMVVESCSNLVPGGALLGFSSSAAVFRIFSGCMKGAGWADLDMIQAKEDNLGDLRRKHGMQNFFVSIASTLSAAGAMKAAASVVGPWAPPLVAAGAAVVANFAMNRFVANYEFHPVNEEAVRKIVDAVDTGAPLPAPQQSPDVKEIFNRGHLTVGQDMRLLEINPKRLEQLKDQYRGRDYIMELVGDKPYIVMREGSDSSDRMVAVMQATRFNKLRDSEAYTAKVAKDGKETADMWALDESLNKTAADPTQLLDSLAGLGWTVDKLRFFDKGERGNWNAEGQFELPLEMPAA